MQSRETLRNSLGLNYKSAALPAVLLAQVGSGRHLGKVPTSDSKSEVLGGGGGAEGAKPGHLNNG